MLRTVGTDDAVAAWEALLRTHAALVPTLSAAVEQAVGIALSWYDVLLELSRTDAGRLRMQALGERVVLSRSQASRVVDAMAAAGLVRKEPDPADGRATLAVITDSGRHEMRRAAPVYLEAIEEHFGSLLENHEIHAILTGLERVLSRHTETTAI